MTLTFHSGRGSASTTRTTGLYIPLRLVEESASWLSVKGSDGSESGVFPAALAASIDTGSMPRLSAARAAEPEKLVLGELTPCAVANLCSKYQSAACMALGEMPTSLARSRTSRLIMARSVILRL